MQSQTPRQIDEAIKYITMGAKLMGWSIFVPDEDYVSQLIVGTPSKIKEIALATQMTGEILSLNGE